MSLATIHRADFLDAVLPVIDGEVEQGHLSPAYGAELRQVARTMNRFAVGAWFNQQARCGCLVGEGFRTGALPNHKRSRRGGDMQYRPTDDGLLVVGDMIDTAVGDAFDPEYDLDADVLIILDGVPTTRAIRNGEEQD